MNYYVLEKEIFLATLMLLGILNIIFNVYINLFNLYYIYFIIIPYFISFINAYLRYTITLSRPSDNCYLSDRNYKSLDFYTDLEPDRDFDVYTMNNPVRCEQPIIKGSDHSGKAHSINICIFEEKNI